MIDLVALQSLMGVAERGTVGAAAESLGYTPSAVSQQLSQTVPAVSRLVPIA